MPKGTCKIDGCASRVEARGWCKKHYTRWWRHGDPFGAAPTRPRAQCQIDGCDEDAHGRGWCSLHYQRWLRRGDPLWTQADTSAEQFWSRVEKGPAEDDCWPMSGSGGPDSHKQFGHGNRGAHRWALEQALGRSLLPGMCALHTCDNPPCVRNDDVGFYDVRGVRRHRRGHLWEGTPQDNTADRDAKGRAASGDRNGAVLHPDKIERGSQRYNAAFTEGEVRSIRQRAAGGESQRALAAEFDVGASTIQKIVSRTSWRHVD